MYPVRVAVVGLAVVGALAAATTGCTPELGESDSADTTPESTLAVPEVTDPPERQTPFCAIMLELDASLPADQTVNVTDQVLAAYREALPVAPPEIAPDLEAVIIGLETGTDPTPPPSTIDPEAPDPEAPDPDVPEPDVVNPDDATTSTSPDPTADTFVPVTEPESVSASTEPGSTSEPPTAEEAFVEEGYTPDDSPIIRLNGYIGFACRDTINNPGPPPTQPNATPAPVLDE